MARQIKRNNGDGCIVRRGKAYYLRIVNPTNGKMSAHVLYLNGQKCATKIEAEEAARLENLERRKIESLETKQEMLVQIAQNKQLISSAKFKLNDIWQVYLESPTRPQNISANRMADERRVVEKFLQWCSTHGVRTVSDVTQDMVQGFLNSVEISLSARSYNAYRGMLRAVFQHAYRILGMASNPVAETMQRRVITQSRKEFTLEQIERIFKCFETGFFHDAVVGGPVPVDGPNTTTVEYRPEYLDEYKVIMLLATFTGCRLGDACQMCWRSVDLQNNALEYLPHKTAHSSGKSVRLPLHPMLRTALLQAEGWKVNDYVCPNVAARYQNNKSGVVKTIQKLIFCATGVKLTNERTDGRARGASQYGMHSFRHTFVSFCANAGVPLAVVADIVGHGNPAMTEHYYHASNEVKARAVAAIQIGPSAVTAREEMHRLIDAADEAKIQKILEFANSL